LQLSLSADQTPQSAVWLHKPIVFYKHRWEKVRPAVLGRFGNNFSGYCANDMQLQSKQLTPTSLLFVSLHESSKTSVLKSMSNELELPWQN